jgi:septal ring factor EnvC (AmiA/AmiB activator)
MAEKERQPEFVVTDRRLFGTDGELRQDVVEDEERRAEREREKNEAQERTNQERASQNHTMQSAPTQTEGPVVESEPEAEPLSAQQQQASADAYKESTPRFT